MAWPSATLFKLVLAWCFIHATSHRIFSIAKWRCSPPKGRTATAPCTGFARFDLNVTETKKKNLKLLFGKVHFIGEVGRVVSSTHAVVGTLDVNTMYLNIGAWHSLTTERLADIIALSENKFGVEQFYLNARGKLCHGKTMLREVGVFDVPRFSDVISHITDIPFGKMQARLNITSNPSFCHASAIHLEKVQEPLKYSVLFTLVYVAQFVVLVLQIYATHTGEKGLAIPLFSVALLLVYIQSLTVYYSTFRVATSAATSACEAACIVWLAQLLTARGYLTGRNGVLVGMLVVAAIVFGSFVLAVIDPFLLRGGYLVVLLECSFFMPQIVKNQTEGEWGALLPSFIVVTALATVTLPLYLYARSSPFLAAFITLYVAAQAGYLLWGGIWKARRTSQYSEITADE